MLVETAEAMLEIILLVLAVLLTLAMMFLSAAMVLAANRREPPSGVAPPRTQPHVPPDRFPGRGPMPRPRHAAACVEGEPRCSANF